MPTILDHTQDLTGSETHRLTNIYAPPDFVKRANHEQLYADPAGDLPPHAWADPIHHNYPAHSAAAVWMSTMFLLDKKAEHHPTKFAQYMRVLDANGAHFGITAALTQLKEAMARDEGDATARLADSDFALVWHVGDKKERHWPLRNAGEVKIASEWFQKNRDEFLYSDRRTIAANIIEKADQYGAAVADRDMLTKTAGYGACSSKDIAEAMEKRATLAVRSYPDLAAEMRNLAAIVTQNPLQPRDHERRVKLAEVLDQFDRSTLLTRLYDAGGLERPEEVFFQVTEKKASEFLAEHVSTTNGTIYEKQALSNLTVEQVRDWMGNEFAEAVSTNGGLYLDHEKLADVVTTLPRDDASAFERMAKEFGIPVFARDKAAFDQGLGIDEMTALAEEYNQSAVLTPSPSVLD